jgi:hypothetical protein
MARVPETLPLAPSEAAERAEKKAIMLTAVICGEGE